MAGFLSWVQTNWSSAIGAAGIIGGLYFTAASFSHDAKAKEVANILTLGEQHRELWNEAHQREDLKRIFLTRVDARPVSVAEEEFLNIVFVHFETGWQMARAGTVLTCSVLARDIRAFFSLPLPRLVWEKTKSARNPRFVRFVERAMKRGSTIGSK
jgi:hypothetical protein